MKCLRCSSDKVGLMCKSPVEDKWEVYFCDTCHYSWRSTETIIINEKFRLDAKTIENMPNNPPVIKKK